VAYWVTNGPNMQRCGHPESILLRSSIPFSGGRFSNIQREVPTLKRRSGIQFTPRFGPPKWGSQGKKHLLFDRYSFQYHAISRFDSARRVLALDYGGCACRAPSTRESGKPAPKIKPIAAYDIHKCSIWPRDLAVGERVGYSIYGSAFAPDILISFAYLSMSCAKD
jgi:hypothetical protein